MRRDGANWLTLSIALAIGSVVLLFVALSLVNPNAIADEEEHFSAMVRLAHDDWSATRNLPMAPGYHLVAGLFTRLLGENLLIARGLNVCLAVLSILLMSRVVAHRQLRSPADALLQFAWNPLLFPFFALVYTETSAVFCLVLALWLQVKQRHWLSGLALLAACLVRQTNVVWVAFMAAWIIIDRPATRSKSHASDPNADADADTDKYWPPQLAHSIRRRWPAVAVHLFVIAGCIGYLVWRGKPTFGAVAFNRVEFNIAQYYLFALCVALLWAPLWAARVGPVWRPIIAAIPRRPLLCGAILAAVAALALAFHNPHAWNYDLHYVRNWALEGMAYHPAVRLLAAAVIVALIPVVVQFTRTQPRVGMVALLWAFALLSLAPLWLADPRYYIVPSVLLNLLIELPQEESRRLTAWYGLLSAAIALFVVCYGSSAGGVW